MDSDYREPNVTKLLEKLEDLSYSESIAFGQQNAAHIGVTLINRDGTSSDVYNLCGKQPAIVGIDTLSLERMTSMITLLILRMGRSEEGYFLEAICIRNTFAS